MNRRCPSRRSACAARLCQRPRPRPRRRRGRACMHAQPAGHAASGSLSGWGSARRHRHGGGDDATGVLRSAAVVLGGVGVVDRLVPVGNDLDRLYSAVVRAGDRKVLAKAPGRGTEQYHRVVFDLSAHTVSGSTSKSSTERRAAGATSPWTTSTFPSSESDHMPPTQQDDAPLDARPADLSPFRSRGVEVVERGTGLARMALGPYGARPSRVGA